MNDAVIVLNYNKSNLIKNIINKFLSFKDMPHLFIVDNKSDDINLPLLKNLENNINNNLIHFIYNDSNLGYAKGNNVALNLIYNEFSFDNVFIMNPDVIIEEEIINYISNFIKNNKDAGVVTIAHVDENFNFNQRQGWDIINYKTEIKTCFYLGRKSYYKKIPTKFDLDINKIDVIDGSFFGISLKLFFEINFFDPNTFLYYEENIIGYKLKNKGYQNYILNYKINPIHNHNESITSKIKFRKNWKCYNKSKKYYCKNYLKINILKRIILNICIFISNIEAIFIGIFKKI